MLFYDLITLGPERLITVYGIYSSIGVLFLAFAVALYRRGQRSQQKAYIIKMFVYIAAGLIINVLYAPIGDEVIQGLGNRAVIYLTSMGFANLLFFTVALLQSTQVFTRKKSVLIEVVIAAVAALYYALPVSFKMPDFSPIWPLEFNLFTIALTQTLFVLALVFGAKTVQSMQDATIKKRLKYFLLGVCMFEMVVVSTILRNGQVLASLGSIGSTLLLMLGLCIVPGGILVYYGVGKNIK